jgi:hypothetical protein
LLSSEGVNVITLDESGVPMMHVGSLQANIKAGTQMRVLTAEDIAILQEAGVPITDKAAEDLLIDRRLAIPPEWQAILDGAKGDALVDVESVAPQADPYAASADSGSSGGSEWVDYGSGGGGRSRSYSRGGGGGYSRSYGGGGGYSDGYSGGGGIDLSWLPEGFGGEDGFMAGSFDSPIFDRYFAVLSQHLGADRAISLMRGMRGMKRGMRRSRRSRSRSMPGGRTLTTKGPQPSSLNAGLTPTVPSNEGIRQDVGKQVKKATKGKD